MLTDNRALCRYMRTDGKESGVSAKAIADALSQVKDELRDGVPIDEAFAAAGEEFGLNPILLRRKFNESTGTEPAAWLAAIRATEKAALDSRDTSRRLVSDRARRLASERWNVTNTALDLAGRIFSINGREYAWVAYVADRPDTAIRAIEVATHREVFFNRARGDEILQQIAPNVRLVA